MPVKTKKPQFIFFIYWFLLAYIVAALIFWFIELSRQNNKMAVYKTDLLQSEKPANQQQRLNEIQQDKKRKEMQYAGEGATFLLLIMAGAIFVYRSVKKQLRLSQQQQSFMMGVTHELKTPVAIAKLNLETLQKRKLDQHQQQRLMSTTLQEINRLDDLCNNMLVSSQIEAGAYRMHMEHLDCTAILEKLAEEYRQRHPGREIFFNASEHLHISGDEVLLHIMVGNLLENAMKYTTRNKPVNLEVSRKNSMAHIQVSDQGPGISNEEKKKIFRKFYRSGNEATKSAKGTGIGLYLVKNLVKAHKGKVYITDNSDGGSIFNVEIPLV
ncbi:MAG: HAMP domain-containing sensor histidine kinase [Ferruginibacter sp.]